MKKNYHPSYLFPSEWFINNDKIKIGLGYSEQRRKSILIHGHTQNREPLPLNRGSTVRATGCSVFHSTKQQSAHILLNKNCCLFFFFVCLFGFFCQLRTFLGWE